MFRYNALLFVGFVVLTICPINSIQAEPEVSPGPFGLTMGTTLRDINKRGINLRELASSGGDYYTSIVIESPPIKYDRFASYHLFFTDVHGLYSITATTPRYLISPSPGQTLRSKMQKTVNDLLSYWEAENSNKFFKDIKRIFVAPDGIEGEGYGVTCVLVLTVEFANVDVAQKYIKDRVMKRAGYK